MIWLARHGETTWNAEGRYQGRRESHLSELGTRQANALAAHFAAARDRGDANPQRIVSSPLARTRETAAPIARALGLEIETDDRLIEIAHGTWEGEYRNDIERDDPERYAAWRARPERVSFDGGESLGDVMVRWQSFSTDVFVANGADVLVMTHDAVVRCALLALRGETLERFWQIHVENASYATIANTEGVRLVSDCETSHLANDRAPVKTQAL